MISMVMIIIQSSLWRWLWILLWTLHFDGVSGEQIGLFSTMQLKFLNPHSIFPSIIKALEYFLDGMLKASETAIHCVMISSKAMVSWWNPELRGFLHERKKAL